jgi:hypothetical protein
MSKPGWGAVLVGEPVDLDDWTFQLKEAFDPWVEVHSHETILRSASLDELTSASDVRDRATALIERLNGALALSRTEPLRFGSVVQFAPNGSLNRFLFPDAATYTWRTGGADITVVTFTDPDSKPQPSQVQNWALIADSDELLDDALIYFGRVRASARHPEATDWFDVYKALECLMLRFGSEADFLKTPDIARLKRTANWARHARRKYEPPPNPMEFSDARTLLGNLIRRALSEAS